jgi:hypothetical protein
LEHLSNGIVREIFARLHMRIVILGRIRKIIIENVEIFGDDGACALINGSYSGLAFIIIQKGHRVIRHPNAVMESG